MNRTFAIFLAIALLIAHTLAIHKNTAGEVAPPYDAAHVAYRLARNLVQSGAMSWDRVSPGFESYPSLLWIGVAAFAERVYFSVTLFCQLVGALSGVLTVVVLAQFSRGRLAGVIAPLLFVASGCAAAAAGSGTEAATFALLMTFAFLAFEQRWKWALAIALALVCVTRAEGVVFTAGLFVMEVLRVAREKPPTDPDGKRLPRRSLLAAFALPVLAVGVVAGTRAGLAGALVSPWLSSLARPEPGQWARGFAYLWDFVLSSGGPLLIVFPIWYLLRRSLSGLGTRAFVLTVLWAVLVVFSGGGSQPFFQEMVPILAILLVAVQEGMTVALDSRRKGLPQVTWVLFLLGLASSGLVSKYPGNLGPFETEALHRAWMEPGAEPPFGYEAQLGRLGQAEEIDVTERLRAIGIYLRDQIDPSHAILTPWPGAIGYLSGVRVIDAFGRTSVLPDSDRTRAWTGRPRVDVMSLFELAPEYVLPTIRFGAVAPSLPFVARTWAEGIDSRRDPRERSQELGAALRDYELLTVPIDRQHTRSGVLPRNRFFLLRRADLGLAPVLHVGLAGRRLRVDVEHSSHEQIVDLRVQVVARDGEIWSLRPTGEAAPDPNLISRSSILLFPTGMRRIELLNVSLPSDLDPTEIRAVLLNPGAQSDVGFGPASTEVVVPVL